VRARPPVLDMHADVALTEEQRAAVRRHRLGEWAYFRRYHFGGGGGGPRRLGYLTWLAELAYELAHRIRYPRFRYLYKVDLASLGVTDLDAARGVQYECTNSYALHQSFVSLRRFLKDPETAAFIDVGSGAGRVLHEAALNGFRRLAGIEISSSLCALSEGNLRRYLPSSVEFRIFNVNVRAFDPADIRRLSKESWEPRTAVFFLNNPFNEELVEIFANKVDHIDMPETYVVCIWKQYPHIWLARGFEVLHEQRRRGQFTHDSFRIYHRGANKVVRTP
jgi:16S rRNA G966 N2-methylase RsmD